MVRTIVAERFDLELAANLTEARACIAERRYDAVILDLTLPDGSGWDLLAQIRESQPDSRVVLLSGTEITPSEAAKVEAALLKSQVTPRQLLEAIGSRLRRR